MKQKVNILLLLSISVIGSTSAASRSSNGNGSRSSSRQDQTPALIGIHTTQPTHSVAMPSYVSQSSQPVGFGALSNQTPVVTKGNASQQIQTTWANTAQTTLNKTAFPKWDSKITRTPSDELSHLIALSHDQSNYPTLPDAISIQSDDSHPLIEIIADTHKRRVYLPVIAALGGVLQKARELRRQDEKRDESQFGDRRFYSTYENRLVNGNLVQTKVLALLGSGYLRQAIKMSETQSATQPKAPRVSGDQEHNFENQILNILGNSELTLLEKQRRIGAILIEEQRNHLDKGLPSRLQLATFLSFKPYQTQIAESLALFKEIDFAKPRHISALAKNLGIGQPEMSTDNEEKLVGHAYLELVQELRDARCSLEQMKRLQILRDAQLAFVKNGDVNALLASLSAGKKKEPVTTSSQSASTTIKSTSASTSEQDS